VRVTLIDRHNYHQFQPLFYQLATSQLSVNDVSFSLRRICCDKKNIDIKLAEVAKVDPQTRSVHTKEDENYQGDYLSWLPARKPTSSVFPAPMPTPFRSIRSPMPSAPLAHPGAI